MTAKRRAEYTVYHVLYTLTETLLQYIFFFSQNKSRTLFNIWLMNNDYVQFLELYVYVAVEYPLN